MMPRMVVLFCIENDTPFTQHWLLERLYHTQEPNAPLIRNDRTDETEPLTPPEAKASHRSGEICSMTNYREILRLHSLGFNKTEIASSCKCARNTVAATLQRAANCGLKWPLPEGMSDRQLSERLFPASSTKPVYKMPDYAYVHKELQRSGVTLNLLWLEYCDQCRSAGEIPYQSTQFNKYYADYLAKTNATMHLNHKPGEVMLEGA